jgi:hypothetical protein
MAVPSQMIAGVGVEYAKAEERSAHQQVDDVQHDGDPFEDGSSGAFAAGAHRDPVGTRRGLLAAGAKPYDVYFRCAVRRGGI